MVRKCLVLQKSRRRCGNRKGPTDPVSVMAHGHHVFLHPRAWDISLQRISLGFILLQWLEMMDFMYY